jgi:hypothetical protein
VLSVWFPGHAQEHARRIRQSGRATASGDLLI